MRAAQWLAMGAWAALVAVCVGNPTACGQALPSFSAENFGASLTIDNPYFPLVPGTNRLYDGVHTDPETDEMTTQSILFEVLPDVRIVAGVAARVVRDRVWEDGLLIEDTYDWYAQDNVGNVWYLGEYVTDYFYDAGGIVTGTDHAGSWEAGIDGAQPGFIMEAHPQLGDFYYQEYYLGHAEDQAKVIGLGEMHTVPHGAFTNVLRTLDTSGTDPTSVAHKFYAPGVGTILEHDLDDDGEVIGVTSLRALTPEPSSATLAAAGVIAMGMRQRRRAQTGVAGAAHVWRC